MGVIGVRCSSRKGRGRLRGGAPGPASRGVDRQRLQEQRRRSVTPMVRRLLRGLDWVRGFSMTKAVEAAGHGRGE